MIPNKANARAQIVAGLVNGGMAHRDALMAADVAMHAAEQAFAKIAEICEPLEGTTWLNAYSIALQATRVSCDDTHAGIRDEARKMGVATQSIGMSTRQNGGHA